MAKKLTSLPDPISFPLSPAVGGLNTEINARGIDLRESPDTYNTREYKGQITTRTGFKAKYLGARESLLFIDYLYALDGTQTIFSVSSRKLYSILASIAARIPVYKGDGTGTLVEGATPLDVFIMDPTVNWWGQCTGKTRIQPFDMNAGAIWPNSSDFGDLRLLCNDADGIIAVAITGAGAEAEILTARSGTAPLSARAMAFYGGRLIAAAPRGVGGFALNAYLQWSAVGRADLWDAADGGGAQLIGDESDAIQALSKIGEYLIVYKERSIYIGNQTILPLQPFYFVPAPNQAIGMAAPLTIGELGEEQIFLGWDNIYRFSLSGITPMGDKIKRDLLFGTDGIVPSQINRCVGVIAEEFDEYWLFIPTGKSPSNKDNSDIFNECPNPTMALAEISASTTASSQTIGSISTSDIALVNVGDGISGAGIPAGSVVQSKGATSVVISNAATKTTVKNKLLITPEGQPNNQWSVITDGSPSFSYQTGGNFGPYFNRFGFGFIQSGGSARSRSRRLVPWGFRVPWMTGPDAQGQLSGGGTYATLRSGQIDFGEVVTGHDLSLLVWLRVDRNCAVNLTVNQESGAQLYTLSLNVVPSSAFQPYVYDFVVAPGGLSQHFTVDITSLTPFANVDVDAVQLVDISNVDSTYVDQSSGYKALGARNAVGQPEMIPFVIDRIGQWVCDTVWVYNYTGDSWWRWRLPVNGFGFDVLSSTIRIADLKGRVSQQTWRFSDKLLSSLAPTNLISPSDGQIYEISKTYNLDWQGLLDRSILNYWQSKDFDLGRPDLDKTLSRVVIHHGASHPPTVVIVSASTDSGATWEDQTITMRQGFTETYADFVVTGTQVRFKVQAQAGMFIDGFSVKIAPRGEAHVN